MLFELDDNHFKENVLLTALKGLDFEFLNDQYEVPRFLLLKNRGLL